MMYSGWVEINFSAGHRAIGVCASHLTTPSGHLYRIRAYCTGKYDPSRRAPLDEIRQKLDAIHDEFAGQMIDDLTPGVMTTPAGIAAYMLERLGSDASAVRVMMDETTAMEVDRRN